MIFTPCWHVHADINECDGDHKCEYKCQNSQGSFTCLCPDGYQLRHDRRTCEGRTCMYMFTEFNIVAIYV